MKTKELIKKLEQLGDKEVYYSGEEVNYGYPIDHTIETPDKIVLMSQEILEKFYKNKDKKVSSEENEDALQE
jgi:hypothetical protein